LAPAQSAHKLLVRWPWVRSLEIEELAVKRLRVGDLIVTNALVTPDEKRDGI